MTALGIDEEPPLGSVVQHAAGDLWQRHPSGWWLVALETVRLLVPEGTQGAPWSAMVGWRRGPVSLVPMSLADQ